MYDRPDAARDEEATRALAVRFCRDVYLCTGATVYKWLSVPSMASRLNASIEDAQVAIKYGVRKGWLDGYGNPIFVVMLLEPGRSMFANADLALPRR
jgi:hypothetical protein